MRFFLCKCLLALSVLLLPLHGALAQAPPRLQADGAVLMDARTGQVLFEKNAYKSLAPASTTKIMTAIIAIESGRLDEKATVSKNAASTNGSTIHLEEGQVITLRELLNGLMLRSGNDSAVAIAEFIAGTVDNFVAMMNEKAAELGAYNTHFRNPHGLSAPGHRSTAYDLAWITRYAMHNQTFADIVNTKQASIDWQDSRGNEHARSLKNTNKLLWMLEEADGVKTGTTNEAGPCLVSSATKGDQRLIAVTLRDPRRWEDSQKLLEWGFANYALYDYAPAGETLGEIRVADGFVERVEAVLDADAAMVVERASKDQITARVDLPETVNAPVYQGQKIGELQFAANGKVLRTFDLVAKSDSEEKTVVRYFLHQLADLFKYFANWGLL